MNRNAKLQCVKILGDMHSSANMSYSVEQMTSTEQAHNSKCHIRLTGSNLL